MKITSPVQRKRCRIEIIPLIDIMFFLLASFMMISLQMEQTQNIKVTLPGATKAKADFRPNMINIAVDKSGDVWLEKKRISLPELGAVISNKFHFDTNLPVYVSGDSDAMEGAVQDVLQTARNAGVQKVAFMVTDRADGRGRP